MNLALAKDFDIEQHFKDNGIPYEKVEAGQGGIFYKQADGTFKQISADDFMDPRLKQLQEYEAIQTAKVTDLQGAMLIIKDVGSPVDQLMYSKLCTACAGANNEVEMQANMRIATLMETYIMDLANQLLSEKYGRINMDILLFIHSTQYSTVK